MASKLKTILYDEKETTKQLKVATVAMQCDREPAVNRAKMVKMTEAIKRAHPDVELVVFGEVILCWYNPEMREYHYRTAEPIPGETTRAMVNLAVEQDLYISFGLSESSDGKLLYNAQVLINPTGEIQAVHRKWNLKPHEKKANYQSGPVPVTITDIKGVKTGIAICSDAASPRAMWELMKSRLDLIILSLADDSDEGLFMARFNARMYDAWIVTANRYGDEGDWFWNGHIVISDPLGSLRATAQDKEGYLVCELGFDTNKSWLRRIIRNMIVKAPLPFHVLRNWRRVREYR
jgi:predicted amidohydrolase